MNIIRICAFYVFIPIAYATCVKETPLLGPSLISFSTLSARSYCCLNPMNAENTHAVLPKPVAASSWLFTPCFIDLSKTVMYSIYCLYGGNGNVIGVASIVRCVVPESDIEMKIV